MTTQELTKEVVDLKTWRGGVDERLDGACEDIAYIKTEVKEQVAIADELEKLS